MGIKGYIYTMFKGCDPGEGFELTDPIFSDDAGRHTSRNVRSLVSIRAEALRTTQEMAHETRKVPARQL